MNNLLKLFGLLSLVYASSTFAVEVEKDGAIKQQFLKLGLNVKAISPSPIKGLMQVVTDRGIFYSSQNGKYLVHGKMFDLDNGVANLTEQAMAGIRLDQIKETAGTTIDFKAKDEKYQITIFTDITCGYCRKLHNQMSAYNDLGISVRYLAFPRGGLNSPSFEDLESVWCADDKQKAMTDAKAGNSVQRAKCSSPVAAHYDLGAQFGVTGTPAIVLSDGNMIPGYQPPERLIEVLKAM
ncbi:bifunctional protein-disulfide isomerase/oxidoreductase DsbC [Flocculibacter collagenilyticus]|uniref:bifunctional protein-disulfide isomerase/oxidoreductase DsbC n=1 Tax=Flocculibacter collagenilyticus TaxID=2744479 RepID=UPI0018F55AC2|nr:bifunctional protein-disulfide isomerase/oxidoreductase DsbC [Flocculibacter collagenilyticus]